MKHMAKCSTRTVCIGQFDTFPKYPLRSQRHVQRIAGSLREVRSCRVGRQEGRQGRVGMVGILTGSGRPLDARFIIHSLLSLCFPAPRRLFPAQLRHRSALPRRGRTLAEQKQAVVRRYRYRVPLPPRALLAIRIVMPSPSVVSVLICTPPLQPPLPSMSAKSPPETVWT